jgi:hypothetical protein
MLQKYNEIDFEFNFIDKSRLNFLKRITPLIDLYSIFFNIPLNGKFFFIFSNVIQIDIFFINRFFLLFWLFSGCFGSVQCYKVNYRLGIYYYHFVLAYQVKKKKFFNLIAFFFNDFLRYHKIKGKKKNGNYFIFFFDNLELFTNLKLARGVYFSRITQKLFFLIYMKSFIDFANNNILFFFLESIKINNYKQCEKKKN